MDSPFSSGSKRKSFPFHALLLLSFSMFGLFSAPHLPSIAYGATDAEASPLDRPLSISSFDGAILSGSLTMPSHPRAIIIPVHGSFVQTRDGSLDGSRTWMFPEAPPQRNLFLDISRILYTHNIAMYRYDKRASGQSEGIYKDTDLTTLAKDVLSISRKLRTLYPSLPIGFLGQSEGGLTILKATEMATDTVAFHDAAPDFLLLQGPALFPFSKTLEFQRDRGAKPYLQDKSGVLAARFPYLHAFYQAMYFGDMVDLILNTNQQHYRLRSGDWSFETSLQKYREYFWDGLELLKRVQVPTAMIIGDQDLNVDPEAAREILKRQALGFYKTVSVSILEGLEHSFREVVPGLDFVQMMKLPISDRYRTQLLRSLDDILLRIPAGTCHGALGG